MIFVAMINGCGCSEEVQVDNSVIDWIFWGVLVSAINGTELRIQNQQKTWVKSSRWSPTAACTQAKWRRSRMSI